MAPFNLGRSVSTHSPYHGRLREGRAGIKIEVVCKEVGSGKVASRALVSWMWSLCEGVAERSGGADGVGRRDDAAGAAERPGG